MRTAHYAQWGIYLLAAVATPPGPTIAMAQEAAGAENVLTRVRPELEAAGLSVGGFRVYPTVSQRLLYDDNVFGTDIVGESSYAFETSPRVAVRSNWNRHAFNLRAVADVGKNASFSSEDFLDWQIATDGRLDVAQHIRLSGGGYIGRDHIRRTAPDETRGFKPTEFDDARLFCNYDHQFGRYGIRSYARARRRDYHDVPGMRNGRVVTINQDGRDRTEVDVGLRGRYRVLGRIIPFGQISGNRRDYDDLQDFSLDDRSSIGYEISGGFEFDRGGVTSGEFFAGYRLQDYEEPFPDISVPVFGAHVTWHATPLTSASLDIERVIIETQGSSFSGYVSTATHISAVHELLRNMLLRASFTHTDDEYEGVGTAKREDTTYDLQFGTTYMFNRHIHVLVEYHFLKRETSASIDAEIGSGSIEKNVVSLELQLKL